MLSKCGTGEDSRESLEQQGDQTSWSYKKSTLNIHWKDWCLSWISSTLATWCEELTHWKSPCCWERLKAEGEGGNRRWDSWMAPPTSGHRVAFLVSEHGLKEHRLQWLWHMSLVSPWYEGSSQTGDWTLHWQANSWPLDHQGSQEGAFYQIVFQHLTL